MPPTKPPYPPELRHEAVQLAQNTERSIAQVARDLGVSDQTLRNWIKQAAAEYHPRFLAIASPRSRGKGRVVLR